MVEYQCVHTDVPETGDVWRNLCHRTGKWMDIFVDVHPYNVVLNCADYSIPLSSVGEDTWQITEHHILSWILVLELQSYAFNFVFSMLVMKCHKKTQIIWIPNDNEDKMPKNSNSLLVV